MACRCLTALAFMGGLTCLSASAANAKPDPAQIEFFEKDVRPVLLAKCIKCHGPDKQSGGLRLDSRPAMVSGGDSGPAMVVGKPDESRFIKAIRYQGDIQMPPKGKLTEEQVAALTRWVKLGAPWPATDTTTRVVGKEFRITPEDRAFWSFQPVKDPPLPAVKNAAWAQSPIDRFLLAELEAKGLQPMPPADKRTLLRRASLDLIGLPPAPEEMEQFVVDSSKDAFGKAVDRLLASPHYGERWGRHWLDVARYGEDQAHTFAARLYPSGFRYRDWVVKSLNDDMPYDRFLMEQVAGDLLDGPKREERLAALGYFAIGPVYYGKAVADELDDRVDTLSRGMLGLTVACARCHNHKFDPIPTQDYYSLAGIFSSTEYKEYPIADAETTARFERATAAVTAKNNAIAELLRKETVRASEAMTADVARYVIASWKLVNERKTNRELKLPDFAKRQKLHDFFLERWTAFLFPKGEDARPQPADWRKLIAEQDAAKDLSADKEALAAVEKVAAAFQEQMTGLRDKPDEAAKNVLYKEVVGGLFAIPRQQVERFLRPEARNQLKAERAELDRLKKEVPQIPTVHSLTEGTAANMKVYLRGNPATPGDEAPRRFLGILSGNERQLFTQGSGRLQLARAIASKDNPLTARVIVNRMWMHHFGKGLVATPSNFGRLGERPTHPELLDYLASRFMAGGWSLKALHREIMLSAAYQLSSRFDAANFKVDPGNRLYWRMDRRRLEVEPWRDSLLAVSGSLDRTVGGPPLDLSSLDNRRRTVYAAVSRHNLDSLLRLFDFPDPNITSDRRPVTTVALQQLFVLNSEFMIRQAKALSARLNETKDEDDAARIRRAFLLVYSRPARDKEVELGVAFLKAAAADKNKLTPWEQYAQVLLSANEFVFVD
jgi:cytochrome c553